MMTTKTMGVEQFFFCLFSDEDSGVPNYDERMEKKETQGQCFDCSNVNNVEEDGSNVNGDGNEEKDESEGDDSRGVELLKVSMVMMRKKKSRMALEMLLMR